MIFSLSSLALTHIFLSFLTPLPYLSVFLVNTKEVYTHIRQNINSPVSLPHIAFGSPPHVSFSLPLILPSHFSSLTVCEDRGSLMDFWRVSPWRRGSATCVYRFSCWVGGTARGGIFPPSQVCSAERKGEATMS